MKDMIGSESFKIMDGEENDTEQFLRQEADNSESSSSILPSGSDLKIDTYDESDEPSSSNF